MIFITGTNTDIGKTYVSNIIGKHLKFKEKINVGYLKPVESGGINDTKTLKNSLNLDDDLAILNPINFKTPISPNIALEIENKDENKIKNKDIYLNKINNSFNYLKEKYSYLIVEGAGGVAVPLIDNFLISDLIKYLNLPVLLVIRPDLGTINHTLLSIEHLKNKNIEIKGIVVNCIDNLDNVLYYEKTFETIEKISNIKIIGIIYDKDNYNINFTKLI